MTIKQSEHGRIRLLHDFTGEEINTGPDEAHANAIGGVWNIKHGFTIKGDALDDVQALVDSVEDGLNGQVTLTSSNLADGDAIYCTTETCFKPSVNAPMAVECRLKMAALTARAVFVGFTGVMADDQSDLVAGSTSTIAYTETNLVGFLYDVGLTTDIEWHMVHSGGTTTAVTDGLLLNSGVTPVLDEMNVLRVEVDNSGTARWYIDGELLKTLEGAVSTTAIFAGCVGAIATDSGTSATVTVDYIAVEAERDWTI